ncbi:isoleucyl-tRNA synthetase [Rhizoctonia solani AG-1 IB]|uniref:Isoleucyl-tRNA synthetase n=1 Tax=Thanatephorus cucumeris (strain AG1-IB / isolate 7/3/14) TaxID=1108050 RepID=M5BRC8_THACB|nr:isoleucyl-tRNA synthetase [Rhizoctonia solani AG-1 IB]
MASYTPFITENIYQGLRGFIPKSADIEDDRSIHFVPFPDVKEEYFDSVIERQVKRMQSVIELTRTLRERHSRALKVRIYLPKS